MLFIYWLQNHPVNARKVEAIRARMRQRHDRLITGAFTFGEVLAGAYRDGNPELADGIRVRLRAAVTEVIPFTLETASLYASIRGTLGVSSADAIPLAAA